MPKFLKKTSHKASLPPGTLVHIGERKTHTAKIDIIEYDEEKFRETEVLTAAECAQFKGKLAVTWINVDGVHQVDILEELGDCFGLHPLVLEDILNTDHRPKMEDFGDYIYVVLKMLSFNESRSDINTEQISLILGSNFVISFQEQPGDIFAPVKERIRNGKGRTRKMGADYLAHALIDTVIDQYFVVLEKIGDIMDHAEANLTTSPSQQTLHTIHNLRREIVFMVKSVWPMREVISSLERTDSPLIQHTTSIYLRDIYDHIIQIIDTTEAFREMVSGMLDIYLSTVSNRINAVMKMLTLIATIFMPLTFVAGIYGMNFKYMPELDWQWGYPAILCAMFAIAISMLIYFRKKQWV